MALAGLRVLLAEDNPTNQMVAVQMLESLGAEVSLAVDGAEALDMLRHQRFHVALIDIEMPRISGIDLIRRVRAGGGHTASMPLIALTAYVMREHRSAIEQAGADGIIAKPILSIEKFGRDILEHVEPPGDVLPRQRPDPVEEDGAACGMDHDVYDRLRASFDPAGRAELVASITEDVLAASATVESALETDDREALCSATHILVSVAGAIGAFHLQSLAQCLNSAGHSAETRSIELKGRELLAEAERVLEFVKEH